MKKDDEREKEWEKDGRMRGKSKKEGEKKPWVEELIERMWLFLVVIHSNVFT